MPLSLHTLSSVAIFLGAFLLFAIQPMAGKQLLPTFGGSSSVWAISLLFFTSMLFLGYLHAFLLARFARRTQAIVHASLAAVITVYALLSAFSAEPSIAAGALAGEIPAFHVLSALFLSIGPVYFLLATTGPLIQYWYGSALKKEPYALYSLSNAASFLALLSYPFLVEAFLPLRDQKIIWLGIFLLYAVSLALSAAVFYRSSAHAERVKSHATSYKTLALWTLLAALPTFMLVATTTQITQAIAPVPLLWIMPLALYLITFVIAFRGGGTSIVVPFFFMLSAFGAYYFLTMPVTAIALQVASYLVLLFFCCLVCHALLYSRRPTAESSPLFYLFVAFGGMIGSLCASIIAPLIFTDYREFPLGVAISAVLALWLLPMIYFPRILAERHIFIAKIAFTMLTIAVFIVSVFSHTGDTPSITSRNFYGSVEVVFGNEIVSLTHGTTLHGFQFADTASALLPTTYYTPGSGVGRSILYQEMKNGEDGVRVAVIGLGTGTIAAYCRPQDEYVFYEIDPHIEKIARSYFSYLSQCEHEEVRVGDGRVLLGSERRSGDNEKYDVLAVDAFSDDTIPMHLLTLQAFELYAAHLRGPGSILTIHVSNRYLDLSPVVFRLAAELGFSAMLVSDDGSSGEGGSASAWVVLTKDTEAFRSTAFANTNSYPIEATKAVWTDDHSSLLPVLNIPLPWE